MERRFLKRRFFQYFMLLCIPTLLVLCVSIIIMNAGVNDELDLKAKNTLANVSANLDSVISGVIFQNDQLTNNSYMSLSLRKLLIRGKNMQYSDAIYLRTIRTMMSSIIQAYPYIHSTCLYLDGYEYCFSSDAGVVLAVGGRDFAAKSARLKSDRSIESLVETRFIDEFGRKKQVMSIYRRMLLVDGLVVMNIDTEKYCALLNGLLIGGEEAVHFYNEEGVLLLSWNNRAGDDARALMLEYGGTPERQNTWITADRGRYLLHMRKNEKCGINLVSLISTRGKAERLKPMLELFAIIFIINIITIMLLSYYSTRRSFAQINHLNQVFSDAERGIYPTRQMDRLDDEYDVIMNNIICLYLQTVQLNTSLTKKQHEQEIAELTALQLQINPHFLFNTLQNVKLEVQKSSEHPEKANKMIENLADILKYALADPQQTITLREEVQYLKKYVAIQQRRFSAPIIIYYDIEDGLEDVRVFRLMLQPIVENSILHGIRKKEGQGYIELTVARGDDGIHFTVSDNGVGMNGEELEMLKAGMLTIDVHHLGLTNVNSRLKLYYGESAGISISSEKGRGCTVEFVIPDSLESNTGIKKVINDTNDEK